MLAVAYDEVGRRRRPIRKDDERDLILKGYVAFLDPPKETAAPAIAALKQHGVSVKILTGDNELVSRKICGEVGLPTEHTLVGSQVEAMSDEELARAAEKATLFARLSPAAQAAHHPGPASRRARRRFHGRRHQRFARPCGPPTWASPSTRAVDIAKEAADVILLEKSLMVLEEGVLEGRKVFANILKYIRMGASSNFGNMFSVLGASVLLPFLPMLPIQILTNNLLYDFSQVPIPADNVDPEQIAKPRPWNMGEIARFILFIGPMQLDLRLHHLLAHVLLLPLRQPQPGSAPGAAGEISTPRTRRTPTRPRLFNTGWLVESLLTQTLIIHVIRTNRMPFLQSWASLPMVVTTAAIMLAGVWLPSSPLAEPLGLVPLP